ncbi:uncharacterized protein EV154DRAFT_274459 [Mucor mucedo]|uniref:uncharacterized protein n=1 Tax=Mucor mucedo TaxID=29922 RepID=UPI0022211B8C|nr:uncharacterized protein EV154DRAFT_274459 [Mucor mucedo]KAI7889590.1 hypothetical protein EV154DRAFT_274459 [Mucor mucedo]
MTSASFTAVSNVVHVNNIVTHAMNGPQKINMYLEEVRKPTSKDKGKLSINQSSRMLELNESWSGRKCHLSNKNGCITVHGSLVSNGSIELETTKGDITIDGHMVAAKDIKVKTNHGFFSVLGSSVIADNLTIEASYKPLQISSQITVKKLLINTKHAPIILNRISLASHMSIKAYKAPVDVSIQDITSSSAKIEIETTKAAVNVYLSSKFSGNFDIRSKNGLVTVIMDNSAFGSLLFENTKDNHKSGCFKSGKKSKNTIYIRTCNAPATLYIQ